MDIEYKGDKALSEPIMNKFIKVWIQVTLSQEELNKNKT